MGHYSATKAKLLSISRSFAEMTRATNVTVNAVLPGATGTDGLVKYIGDAHPALSQEDAEKKFITGTAPIH